jgi:hypothetical protein
MALDVSALMPNMEMSTTMYLVPGISFLINMLEVLVGRIGGLGM